MNAAAVAIIFGGLLALSSAYPVYGPHAFHQGLYHGGVYPYHGYMHQVAHQVAVPVHYDTYPYIRDASGNTVPFGGQVGDENLDGLPDFQDTNR